MKDVAPDTRLTDATAAVDLAVVETPAVVETLEARQLMSGVTFDGGVLTITGLAGESNVAAVGVSRGHVHTILNGSRRDFGLAKLKAIKINGGDAADLIIVDPSVKVPVRVSAGGGNDLVGGGSGGDVIEAGAGNDIVYGNGGSDAINGGAGDDRLYGNAGHDMINGGAGSDVMVGGEDNDSFLKVGRFDRVFGGSGRNSMTKAVVNASDTKPAVGNTPASAVQLTGLSLVNADTGSAIAGYENMTGSVSLDLTKLPAHLSVAAKLAGGGGTVRFDLDGNVGFRIENSAPYALGGDMSGKFKPVAFSTGTHTLTAAALVGGSVVNSRTVTFKVSKSVKTPVASTPTTPTVPSTPSTPSIPTTPTTPTDNTAARPVAAITAIAKTIPAGTSLHVDALASQLKGGNWNEGHYDWNFGDAAGTNNVMHGFNAGHVYDRAGTYTVSLTVTNPAGKVDTETATITVTPAARRVIYVSSRGSDSANGLTTSTAIQSIDRALAMLDDNTEILFRRGDTFGMTQSFIVKRDNVVIGAYGSGANPNILWTGTRQNQVMFYINRGTTGFTAQDLTVDTIFNKDSLDAGTPTGFQMGGTNFTARRCTLLNLMHGFNLNMNPNGVMIEGNRAPSVTGLRKYFAWVQGSDITIVGNQAANSTREHIVRVNFVSKLNVSENDFANISRREIGDYWDYRKTALNIQSGEFAYAYHNTLDASLQVGPLGKTEGMKGEDSASMRFKYAVAEGNEVIDDQIVINHGAEHVSVRDNVIRRDGDIAIDVDGYDGTYGRGVVDLTIENNTAINSDVKGSFLDVWGLVAGIRLTGNVYVAPNLHIGQNSTAVIKLQPGAYESFTEIDNNVWPVAANIASYIHKAGAMYIGPGYTAPYFKTAEEWNALHAVGDDTFRTLTTQQADGFILNGVQVGARKVA